MKGNEWQEVSRELGHIHPEIKGQIGLFEEYIDKTKKAAENCGVEGFGYAIVATKHMAVVRNTALHLQETGAISEELFTRFITEMEGSIVTEFGLIYLEFCRCVDKFEDGPALARLIKWASTLDDSCLDILHDFAKKLKEIRGKEE